jgi:hypothetical protein
MLSIQLQHSQASRQAVKTATLGLVRTLSSPDSLSRTPAVIRASYSASQQHRLFSSTPTNHLRDFFPVKETPHIHTTRPAWPHEGYTYEEMMAVEPAHRVPKTLGDKTAWKIVRVARYCMDKVTGMDRDQKSDKSQPTTAIVAQKPLTEAQWVSHADILHSWHYLSFEPNLT